jgi:putative flippase GtrA
VPLVSDSQATAERSQPGGLVRQFIRYFEAAAAGLMVDFGVLVLLTTGLGFYHLIGATAGFLAGLAVVYLLSERYVFARPKINHRGTRFVIFGLVGLVGLGLLNALMYVATDVLGLFYLWSKVLATCLVYLWNFFGRRFMYRS